MTDTLELTVESMGAAGDGVARNADGPIFFCRRPCPAKG